MYSQVYCFFANLFFVSFNKLVRRAVIITNFGMTTAQQLVHMSQFRSISKITKIPSLEKNIQFQHKRLFAVLYYKFTPISFDIYFSRRGPRCLDTRLSQHYTRQEMTFCHFSNFCIIKFPGLTKKVSAHFWATLWIVIWKNYVAKPLDSLNESRRILLSSRETFSAEI